MDRYGKQDEPRDSSRRGGNPLGLPRLGDKGTPLKFASCPATGPGLSAGPGPGPGPGRTRPPGDARLPAPGLDLLASPGPGPGPRTALVSGWHTNASPGSKILGPSDFFSCLRGQTPPSRADGQPAARARPADALDRQRGVPTPRGAETRHQPASRTSGRTAGEWKQAEACGGTRLEAAGPPRHWTRIAGRGGGRAAACSCRLSGGPRRSSAPGPPRAGPARNRPSPPAPAAHRLLGFSPPPVGDACRAAPPCDVTLPGTAFRAFPAPLLGDSWGRRRWPRPTHAPGGSPSGRPLGTATTPAGAEERADGAAGSLRLSLRRRLPSRSPPAGPTEACRQTAAPLIEPAKQKARWKPGRHLLGPGRGRERRRLPKALSLPPSLPLGEKRRRRGAQADRGEPLDASHGGPPADSRSTQPPKAAGRQRPLACNRSTQWPPAAEGGSRAPGCHPRGRQPPTAAGRRGPLACRWAPPQWPPRAGPEPLALGVAKCRRAAGEDRRARARVRARLPLSLPSFGSPATRPRRRLPPGLPPRSVTAAGGLPPLPPAPARRGREARRPPPPPPPSRPSPRPAYRAWDPRGGKSRPLAARGGAPLGPSRHAAPTPQGFGLGRALRPPDSAYRAWDPRGGEREGAARGGDDRAGPGARAPAPPEPPVGPGPAAERGLGGGGGGGGGREEASRTRATPLPGRRRRRRTGLRPVGRARKRQKLVAGCPTIVRYAAGERRRRIRPPLRAPTTSGAPHRARPPERAGGRLLRAHRGSGGAAWVNNPTLGEFCFTMIGRADIEGSKSDVAMNAWPPQASYPCDQASFCPSAPREVSVLPELALGHLRYALTGVPPQSNSPPAAVPGAGRGRRAPAAWRQKREPPSGLAPPPHRSSAPNGNPTTSPPKTGTGSANDGNRKEAILASSATHKRASTGCPKRPRAVSKHPPSPPRDEDSESSYSDSEYEDHWAEITTEVLVPLFNLLRGSEDLDSPRALTPEARESITKVQEALSSRQAHRFSKTTSHHSLEMETSPEPTEPACHQTIDQMATDTAYRQTTHFI
ncbi:basic proline-rich protein-like [Poecile atricapillus]|uniref:basic proline-rich protein-like n=1 Tax=Poecile atricapillus TaxID=48891 RepID=UPI002738C1C5|nr:basic proline-rich protein-like [Poecile atricapillus]